VMIRNVAVGGTTEANGTWVIARIDANTFDIPTAFVNPYLIGHKRGRLHEPGDARGGANHAADL